MNQQLLRRAWDALDSFKQAYPENWQEDDEQVMVDLMRADIKMSGVQPKWVGLTIKDVPDKYMGSREFMAGAKWAAKYLKEKNT